LKTFEKTFNAIAMAYKSVVAYSTVTTKLLCVFVCMLNFFS